MVRSGKKTNNGYDFETDFSQIRLEKLPSKSASFEEKTATASEFSRDKQEATARLQKRNGGGSVHAANSAVLSGPENVSSFFKKSKEQT